MSNVTIIIGAQWGDEGKGKWIDILSSTADLVIRYQGGNNAGHTLYINDQKIVLHQIPSGIFHNKACALSSGVVVNPVQLVEEINRIKKIAPILPEKLWISERAHVISPWHIYLDSKSETNRKNPIGTTKRGIGPTYSDKSSRLGIRVGWYVKKDLRDKWISQMRSEKEFNDFYTEQKSLWKEFDDCADFIQPFVCDSELKIRNFINLDKKVLIEGAQGSLLDIDHGTYPYVTSSSTVAGGAISSIGFSPKKVENIFGIAKAYITRVGEGPFPTELFDKTGSLLSEKGHEYGATTGRPRRCGWLDGVALSYSVKANGLDGIILNKLDILSEFPEVKIATSYIHPDLGEIKDFPSDYNVLLKCKPKYETFPGWGEYDISSDKISDLPQKVLNFIKGVEEISGAPVVMVGTGVGRKDALFL